MFSNQIYKSLAVGATSLTIDPSTQGYIGAIEFKFATAVSGTIAIQTIKKDGNGVSKIFTVSSVTLSSKTDAIFNGDGAYLQPGDILLIENDCAATADCWIQTSTASIGSGVWYSWEVSVLEASTSSSSTSSSSSSEMYSNSSQSSASTPSSNSSSYSSNSSSSTSSSENYSQSSSSSDSSGGYSESSFEFSSSSESP